MGKKTRKRKFKWIILLLLAVALAGFWIFKDEFVSAEQQYEAFSVTRGDIETYKSFSATLNVKNSETLTNTEGVTFIKELYVTSGQEVKDGDELLMLGTGKIYKASLDGTVNEIRFRKGDYVWPNINLIQVSDMDHLEVSIQVDEYDVKKVEVGQKCIVTVVPLDQEFETEIRHVNRISASNGRVAYYPVTADLSSSEGMLPGMTISVRMADEKAENVLMLPMTAIQTDDDGNTSVLLRSGNEYVEQPVTVGLSDGMNIEIQEGLSEGDTVYAQALTGEEEELGIVTRILRKIFGTHVVINSESTGRGNRMGPGGGVPEDMPQGEGEMPEGFTLPADGDFPQFSGDENGEFPGFPNRDSQEGSGDTNSGSQDGTESKDEDSAADHVPGVENKDQTVNTDEKLTSDHTEDSQTSDTRKNSDSSDEDRSDDGQQRRRSEDHEQNLGSESGNRRQPAGQNFQNDKGGSRETSSDSGK